MQYDCIIGLNDFQKVVIDRENSLITLDDCQTALVEYGQYVKLNTVNNITVQPFTRALPHIKLRGLPGSRADARRLPLRARIVRG